MARKEGRRSESAATAVALTIAGSDSSAGAGIQADLKTFGALGVYGLTAITCVVAETPGLVSKIEAVSAEMVCAQIEVLLKELSRHRDEDGVALLGRNRVGGRTDASRAGDESDITSRD